jgi:hypothetical protein
MDPSFELCCLSSDFLKKTTNEVFVYCYKKNLPSDKIYYNSCSYKCHLHDMNHNIFVYLEQTECGIKILQNYDGQTCSFIIDNPEKYWFNIISKEINCHLLSK